MGCIKGSCHVLGVKHLLGELWPSEICLKPLISRGATSGTKKCLWGNGTALRAWAGQIATGRHCGRCGKVQRLSIGR